MEWVRDLGALSGLLMVVVALSLTPAQWKKPPRQYRRSNRRFGMVMMPLYVFNMTVAVWRRDIFTMVCWTICIAGWGYRLLKLETFAGEKEAKLNYCLDPGHCGRCDYDLTGNTSGVCPECGWKLPQGPIQLESRVWYVWWRGWKIEYLEDPRRAMLGLAIWSAIVLLGEVLALVARMPATGIGLLAVSTFLLVNMQRVLTYERASRHNGTAACGSKE